MASKVHRVRFYNPTPQPINCACYNKNQKLIAFARGDASIEVWDLNHAPYLLKYIPGVEGGSVEALGWAKPDRLLSTGLGGALVEWDIHKLCQKNTVLLTGSAAWCLDINPAQTEVAVGTEQGYINTYSLENSEIVYNKLFDKQEGRVMCCNYNSTGSLLVTGSVDTIRVWNVETGHAITRMSVTRRKKEVVVWSVRFLSDNTIVSGDSYGRLTFWDGTLGEQMESYTTHKADILSIAVSEDEKSIYCSGMDPTLCHFVRLDKPTKEQSSQWVKNVNMHIHQHDVRALVMYGNKLVSAGVDGYLTFSTSAPKWVMRFPPILPEPRSSVCASKKLLLLRYHNHMEIWKLGSIATSGKGKPIFQTNLNQMLINDSKHNSSGIHNGDGSERKILKISEDPVQVASIKTKHSKQILCSELSPTGEFVVYSTDSDFRILKLDIEDSDENNVSMSKLSVSGVTSACDRVAFTESGRVLVCYSPSTAALLVMAVDPGAGATLLQTIALDKYFKKPSLLHLVVSKKTPSGVTYIVAVDASGAVHIFVDQKNKFVSYAAMPHYRCVPSAITVNATNENVIVVYVDQNIVEYDLKNMKVCEWESALPKTWSDRTIAAIDAVPHPRSHGLILRDLTGLTVLTARTEDHNDEPDAKKRPLAKESLAVKTIPVKYLAGFHWLGEDEAVMLEVLPENIVSQLPAPAQLNNWQARA